MFFNEKHHEVPVGIVVNDAGAANHIYSWVEAGKLKDVRIYSTGPAKKILDEYNIKKNLRFLGQIDELIFNSKSLIVGTGWETDVEFQAIKLGTQASIKVSAVIDHWTNYLERFSRLNEIRLPDKIIVTDKYAYEKARHIFKNLPIEVYPNLYLEKQIKNIRPIELIKQRNILLYLTEPIRNNWGKNELGEYQAMNYFFNKLSKLDLPEDIEVIVKTHPSENNEKYNTLISRYSKKNKISLAHKSSQLADLISMSKWVAGCQTYALVVASNAGRKIFISLPKNGPKSIFPHENFEELRKICEK